MISFVSQSTGETINLEKGEMVGEGTFSEVYSLKNQGSETNLVCKEIKLLHPKDTGFFGEHQYRPSYRLYVATNELKQLHNLGLLVGYQQKDDVFYIIMKKIDGTVLGALNNHNNSADTDEIFYRAFKKLKKLHRLGYAHLDAHVGNFMISTGERGKVSLFDFSRTQSASWIGSFADYMIFIPYIPNPSLFFNYYMREILGHAKKHKIQVTTEIFIYTFMAASSVYGVPPLAIEPHMIQRILLSHVFQKIADSLKFARFMGTGPLHIASLALSSLVAYSDWNHGPSKLMNEEKWLYNPIAYLNSAQLITRISKLCETTSEVLDDYILPAFVVKKKTDLLFKYVYPTSARWVTKAQEMTSGQTNQNKLKQM